MNHVRRSPKVKFELIVITFEWYSVVESFFLILFVSSELKNLMKYFDFFISTRFGFIGKHLLFEETQLLFLSLVKQKLKEKIKKHSKFKDWLTFIGS